MGVVVSMKWHMKRYDLLCESDVSSFAARPPIDRHFFFDEIKIVHDDNNHDQKSLRLRIPGVDI